MTTLDERRPVSSDDGFDLGSSSYFRTYLQLFETWCLAIYQLVESYQSSLVSSIASLLVKGFSVLLGMRVRRLSTLGDRQLANDGTLTGPHEAGHLKHHKSL